MPAIAISTDELATLAVANPHHYFVSQIICAENMNFGKYPRELFWPVPEGIRIHSCYIHPLFSTASAIQRYKRMHFANVDYGMIPRMFQEPDRIKVLTDPRDAYINNFASGTRLYETTGHPFRHDDFMAAHGYTYPVQKGLFIHAQMLPCRYSGLTPSCDVLSDVAALWDQLRPDVAKVGSPPASPAS